MPVGTLCTRPKPQHTLTHTKETPVSSHQPLPKRRAILSMRLAWPLQTSPQGSALPPALPRPHLAFLPPPYPTPTPCTPTRIAVSEKFPLSASCTLTTPLLSPNRKESESPSRTGSETGVKR